MAINIQNVNAVNRHLNNELSMSHVYLALYSFFMNDQYAFKGYARFFKHMSYKSSDNAMDILNYQNLRGGDVSISNIPMPIFVILNNNTSSLFQAIYYILNLELYNYNTLLVNHNISRDTGLKTFQDQFIKKQLRLHNKLRLLLRQLDRVGNNGVGLTLMDDDMYDKY